MCKEGTDGLVGQTAQVGALVQHEGRLRGQTNWSGGVNRLGGRTNGCTNGLCQVGMNESDGGSEWTGWAYRHEQNGSGKQPSGCK